MDTDSSADTSTVESVYKSKITVLSIEIGKILKESEWPLKLSQDLLHFSKRLQIIF
jgi:hypothetical protein